MENEKEIEIDIFKIFNAIKEKIIYIILTALILATVAGCFTTFLITPKYSTSCTMYVYSNSDRVSTNSSINVNELDASKQLVNTYIVILKSDNVLGKVIEELDLDMTPGQLSKLISCTQIEDTEVFRVSVTTTDPVLSANIANAVAQVAPEEIVRVVKAGGVEVVDYAKVPENPSSPSLVKNVILGGGLGFVLSFALFFVLALFDTTIVDEKDITAEFDIPILGTVPHILTENGSSNLDSEEYIKALKRTKKGRK